MSASAPVGSANFRGQLLRFVPVDSLGVREGYETWLVDSAYAAQWARKRFVKTPANPNGFMSPDEWQAEADALRRDVDAFVYSWGTETWGKSYASIPGLKKLLELMLRWGDPKQDAVGIVEAIYAKGVPKDERDAVVNTMLRWDESPNSEGAETTSQAAGSAPSK